GPASFEDWMGHQARAAPAFRLRAPTGTERLRTRQSEPKWPISQIRRHSRHPWRRLALSSDSRVRPVHVESCVRARHPPVAPLGVAVLTKPTTKNRHSNASIVAAVDRVHGASIAGALKQAHEYATEYAKAVGLSLGSVVSVSDSQNGF